jgi:hypothetical protein
VGDVVTVLAKLSSICKFPFGLGCKCGQTMKLGTERLEPGIVSLVLLNREAFSRKGKMWENEQFVPTPYSAETDVNVIELRLTDGSYNKTMFRFLTLEFVDGGFGKYGATVNPEEGPQ